MDRSVSGKDRKNDEGEYRQEDRRSQFIIGQAADEAGNWLFPSQQCGGDHTDHNRGKDVSLTAKNAGKPDDG